MKEKKQGFSLFEIMIALVIIAILGGLAYPKYQKMVIRSRQTEAKNILRNISMGQNLYVTMNQEYTDDLSLIDIDIPAETRYAYSIQLNDTKTAFTATARANLDSDPAVDEWSINESNQLSNTLDDAIE